MKFKSLLYVLSLLLVSPSYTLAQSNEEFEPPDRGYPQELWDKPYQEDRTRPLQNKCMNIPNARFAMITLTYAVCFIPQGNRIVVKSTIPNHTFILPYGKSTQQCEMEMRINNTSSCP